MAVFRKKTNPHNCPCPRQDTDEAAHMRKMVFASQSIWYVLTIIIYFGCTLLGFGVAYLITKMLVSFNIF
jgi:hypothetical protein